LKFLWYTFHGKYLLLVSNSVISEEDGDEDEDENEDDVYSDITSIFLASIAGPSHITPNLSYIFTVANPDSRNAVLTSSTICLTLSSVLV
jgi:hypothetical protein